MSDIQDNPRMSMPENTSNNTQVREGKMTRAEALQKAYQVRERKFKCRNCDEIGHFTTNCPTLPIKEKEKIMKVRERNKERKQKSFPINLEKRIKDLPCGLTIEEAFKMIPGYKKEFGKTIKIVKKGEKVNYMGTPEKSRKRKLILGNDLLKKVKEQIDMDKGKINIKGKKGFIDIPVDFFVMKDEMNEEYEEEYEDEELREEKL